MPHQKAKTTSGTRQGEAETAVKEDIFVGGD